MIKKEGFTLLELLFTLGLFCSLILYAFTSLVQLKQKNEADFLINEIRNAVNYAKIQAKSSGITLLLRPIMHKNDWSKGMDLVKKMRVLNELELIQQWTWKIENWNIEWQGINGTQHIFFSGNTHGMSNGQFVLTDKRNQEKMVIYLNRLGRVEVGTQGKRL